MEGTPVRINVPPSLVEELCYVLQYGVFGHHGPTDEMLHFVRNLVQDLGGKWSSE